MRLFPCRKGKQNNEYIIAVKQFPEWLGKTNLVKLQQNNPLKEHSRTNNKSTENYMKHRRCCWKAKVFFMRNVSVAHQCLLDVSKAFD